MYDRFTRKSRVGRGKIPRALRLSVYERDEYTCQFCGSTPPPDQLTIDHLVPVAGDGLDEAINYVTCCTTCNRKKASIPLPEFARMIGIKVEQLPIHGDPIIDNKGLPIEISSC